MSFVGESSDANVTRKTSFSNCYERHGVRYMLSPVRPSVCLSVTFVRLTEAVQIFRNISKALGTRATR